MFRREAICGASGIVCLALFLAAAQEPVVSPPVVILKSEPEYSEEARRARYQGTVVPTLVVDQNGEPENIRVIRSLGLGLDEKAIESARRWRFQPGMKDGKPVKLRCSIEVNFRLLLKGWNLGLPEFPLPAGVTPPALDARHFESPKSRVPGTARLAFDVDEKGKSKNVRVVRSSNRVLESAAVASLRKCRFHSAVKEGQPVSASGTVDLTFNP